MDLSLGPKSNSSSLAISVNQNQNGATQGANSPVIFGGVHNSDAHIGDALNAIRDITNTSIASVANASSNNSDILAQVTAAAQAAAKNAQSGGQTDNNKTFITVVEVAGVVIVAIICGAIWLFTRKSH